MTESGRNDELVAEDKFLQELILSADTEVIEPSPQLLVCVQHKLRARLAPSRGRQNRLRWAGLSAACVAAAVVLALLLQSSNAPVTWAEVVERVQEQPWIHAVDKEHSRETWLSPSQELFAYKMPNRVLFCDLRAKTRMDFIVDQQKLFRTLLTDDWSADIRSMRKTLLAVSNGASIVDSTFQSDWIVSQKQRTVLEDGRNWLEYELTLEGESQKVETAIFRVNLDRKLPVYLKRSGGQQNQKCDFEFPATGPTDIYSLGVPRNLSFEDFLPSGEMAEIVHAGEEARKNMHSYMAFVFRGTAGLEHVMWRNREKWRCEWCIPKQTRPAIAPEEAHTDDTGWWLKQSAQYDRIPVLLCDGRRVFRNTPHWPAVVEPKWSVESIVTPGSAGAEAQLFGDSSQCNPELLAYPHAFIVGDPGSGQTIDFSHEQLDGRDAIRVTSHLPNAPPNVYPTMQYWLDPARGYAVFRSEVTGIPEQMQDPKLAAWQVTDLIELDDFKQSPRGVWYPTTLRHRVGESIDAAGRSVPDFQITHFHLDFSQDMPNELFQCGAPAK